MSKEPIKPGQRFHLPAAQEKNIDNLMKIFGKKEATAALTAMGETDATTWTQIKDTVGDLKDFVAMGGMGTIYNNVKDTMQLQLDQAMAPINNTLNSIVTDILGPIYDDLQVLATELSNFISDGPEGAFWGAMIGSIWGELGQLIGGLLGAGLQQFWEDVWPKLITDIIQGIKDWWESLTSEASAAAGGLEWWQWIGILFGVPPPKAPEKVFEPDEWDPLDWVEGSW